MSLSVPPRAHICIYRCIHTYIYIYIYIYTLTIQQLHSTRRSASSIPESSRLLHPSRPTTPLYILHLWWLDSRNSLRSSRLENFDTRGAGRVTREIKACTPSRVSGISIHLATRLSSTDLIPHSAFDFARKGAKGKPCRVVTFQFVLSEGIYGRPWEIYTLLAGRLLATAKNLDPSARRFPRTNSVTGDKETRFLIWKRETCLRSR